MADIKGIELASDIYGLEDETARNDTETNASAIGKLNNLETTAKTNLVAAINELAQEILDKRIKVIAVGTRNITIEEGDTWYDFDVMSVPSSGFYIYLVFAENVSTCEAVQVQLGIGGKYNNSTARVAGNGIETFMLRPAAQNDSITFHGKWNDSGTCNLNYLILKIE